VAEPLLAGSLLKRADQKSTGKSACATVGVIMAGRSIIALGMLLAWGPGAYALDPTLDVSQYAHTVWRVREGFTKGAIEAIAQTPDGYLWLGTEFGLLRFDGVRALPWQPPAGEYLPNNWIATLLAGRDGSLWIGTNKGLARWNDGKLTQFSELAGRSVISLLEDREGTVWVGQGSSSDKGRLCAIHGTAQCYGEDGSLGAIGSLYEDTGGNLWAGAVNGLWHWKPGPPKFYPMPGRPAPYVSGLMQDDNGTLVIATTFAGIQQLVDGKLKAYPLPGVGRQIKEGTLLRDRNGGLWIGATEYGILHVHQGRTDVFAQPDGLSGDWVAGFLEDREGNIWAATNEGLDRFRDFAVPTISTKQGMSNATGVISVLAARDGSVWLGTFDGLNRWNRGQITIYRKRDGLPDDFVESLFQDVAGRIWASTPHGVAYFENDRFANDRFIPVRALPAGRVAAIAEDSARDLWFDYWDRGLAHLHSASVIEQIPWAKLGRKDWATALVADPVRGGLWVGFFQSGLAYFKDGQIRETYTSTKGLGEGRVNHLRLDRDDTLWTATQGGLSRIKDGRVATLTNKNGLPCDAVNSQMEDDAQALWLYMACGLVRIARSELDAWASDSKRTVQVTVFDSSDGVRSRATSSSRTPSVAKTVDGKLWFLPFDGVSVIDPRHLPTNKLPPPVHIEQVTADRKTYWQNFYGAASSSPPKLPPLMRDLTIDYTALSLVVPEKVRFRYKLEGRDRDWQDAGNRRQAFYTDLPPRNYRFRVVACNNSGVWNEAGTFLDFSIAPAYYQTTWFRVLCVAAFLGLLWALYQYRLHQLQRQFTAGLEARVKERTRIARELHDTLLQSFHGLMFQFQAARNMLPRRPDEAIDVLDSAIGATEQAISEGRSAIQQLRSEQVEEGDLAQWLTNIGEELARSQNTYGNSASFRVTVEGEQQSLSPLPQNEVYRITREILQNAFRHAQAHHIEAEIRYDDGLLRVRIRDDGRGIDPQVLRAGGSAGHWGLRGARERAQQIGARLDFWSEAGAGTEVELSVPAAVAYEKSRNKRRFTLFRKEQES